jgi:hypothetical protein
MPEDDGTTGSTSGDGTTGGSSGDGAKGDAGTAPTRPLDAVADGLAADQVALLGAGRLGGPRVQRLLGRGGAVGRVAGVGVALGITIAATVRTVATVRTARAGVGRGEVGPPYRQVTGFDRARAEADLALVDHRLGALVAALAAGPGPGPAPADARDLVGRAARRLVRWVAAGRPHDDALAPTLRAYDALMDVVEAPATPEEGALEAAGTAYIGAWRATLGA